MRFQRWSALRQTTTTGQRLAFHFDAIAMPKGLRKGEEMYERVAEDRWKAAVHEAGHVLSAALSGYQILHARLGGTIADAAVRKDGDSMEEVRQAFSMDEEVGGSVQVLVEVKPTHMSLVEATAYSMAGEEAQTHFGIECGEHGADIDKVAYHGLIARAVKEGYITSYHEIGRLAVDGQRMARTRVKRNSEALLALATALLDRGRLSGDEVYEITTHAKDRRRVA